MGGDNPIRPEPHCATPEALGALRLGTLPPDRLAELVDHLATCAQCRAALGDVATAVFTDEPATDPEAPTLRLDSEASTVCLEPEASTQRIDSEAPTRCDAEPPPGATTYVIAGGAGPTIAASAAGFLENLARSGLIALADIPTLPDAGPEPIPAADETAALADLMVDRGLLTRFQADELRKSEPPLLTLGPYILRGKLGKGGMGVVYEAIDRERGSRVALKMLPAIDPGSIYRFKREFRARADLVHPNLIALHEFGADGDRWFLTMDLIEGVDFLSYIRGGQAGAGAPIDLERLRGAFRQLAEGLIAVHEAGLLHRDLKPANVLVTAEGRVTILDFGLVAELEEAVAPARGGGEEPRSHEETDRVILGTLSYMSPEQAAGKPITTASDWFAVGVMLYEALTGRRPYVADSLTTLRRLHRRPPVALARLASWVPGDLEELCLGLLDRRPEARYAAEEVLEILGAGAPRRGADTAPQVFVGRVEQQRALRDEYDAVTAGGTRTILLHGRSGAGKSTLVQRFLDSIREDDTVVLRGRCYEQESVPYKALDGLVDALARRLGRLDPEELTAVLPRDIGALARIFPVLERVVPADAPGRGPAEGADRLEQRRAAFAALRELLAAIGRLTPLVLAIDDLQWGDVDSALLLAELLRPPDPPRLLLLASYRSENAEGSECLRVFREQLRTADGEVAFREVGVGPLSEDEARELAARIVGAAPGVDVDAIARESHGNPYFVQELARHPLGGDDVSRGGTGRPLDLDEVLWTRIERLGAGSRSLLEYAAVAARPLAQRELYEAAGLAQADRSAVAELRTAKLIRTAGPRLDDEVETFHDRIRECVRSRLGPGALRDRHARLADAIERSGRGDPETLAAHFLAAAQFERAGVYYAAAADRAAAALAFERAAKLYGLACELHDPAGPSARALRCKLADALANAGRGTEAARAYLRCAGESEGAQRLDFERKAAFQYCASGHIDEGRAAFVSILGRFGLKMPGSHARAMLSLLYHSTRVQLQGIRYRPREAGEVPPAELELIDVLWSTGAGMSMIDFVPGADFQTRSLLRALRAGEPHRIARTLSAHAAIVSTFSFSSRNRALRLIRQAESIGRGLNDPALRAMVELSRGTIDFMGGVWRSSIEAIDRAWALYLEHCPGMAWELNCCRLFGLHSLLMLGELPELARRRDTHRADALDRGDLYAQAIVDTLTGTELHLAHGDVATAERERDDMMERWTREGTYLPNFWDFLSRVMIDLYRGDGASALSRLDARRREMEDALLIKAGLNRTKFLYLRGLAALQAAEGSSRREELLKSARADARRLERDGLPHGAAWGWVIRAAADALEGKSEAAAARFESAAAGFERCEMPVFAAAARVRRGQLLGGGEGEAIRRAAEDVLVSRGIRDVPSYVRLLSG